MYKRRILASIIIMVVSVLLVASVRPTQSTRFIIADFGLDEYGQGIDGFEFYENSTGSWVQVGGWRNETTFYEWNFTSLKLRCWTWFNNTLMNMGDTDEGKLYQRHSIAVVQMGETVFSQQNFTYVVVSTSDDPMWWYAYDIVLDIVLFTGLTYSVVLNYEMWI